MTEHKDRSVEAGKVAVSRADLILLVVLVVLGMGSWVWVDREVTLLLKDKEPREEQFQGQFRVPAQQANLSLAQSELKATQDQLVQARADYARQSATVDALVAMYPQLAGVAAPADVPRSVPAEGGPAYQPYLDARLKQEVAKRLIDALPLRLTVLQRDVDRADNELEEAQRSARQRYFQAQASYLLQKPLWMSFAAFVILLVVASLMFVIQRMARPKRRPPRFPLQAPLVLSGAIGSLAVLFGYQTFEIAGAALAGLLVLLIVLAYLPWRDQTVAGSEE
jgi:hypothetical protein